MNKLIVAAGFITILGSGLTAGQARAEEGECRFGRRAPVVYWDGERYCPAGMYCRDRDGREERFERRRVWFRRYDRDDGRRFRRDRDDRRFDRDED